MQKPYSTINGILMIYNLEIQVTLELSLQYSMLKKLINS